MLDVDGDLDLDAFWAIPFVQRHCAFTYTSCSHGSKAKQEEDGTASTDRYRAVFIGEPIDNADGQGVALHRERYLLLLEQLGITQRDASPAKPAQPWYGNDKAEFRFGNAVPLSWEFSCDARERLANSQQQSSAAAAARPEYDDDDEELLEARSIAALDLGLIPPTAEGQYEEWEKILNAAAAFQSEAMQQAFMAWHHKGFHGQGRRGKPAQRVSPRRWQNAGRSNPKPTLLKKVKEIHGAGWLQLLPQELRHSRNTPPRLVPRTIFSEAPESSVMPLDQPRSAALPPAAPAVEVMDDEDLPQGQIPRTIFSELIDRNPPIPGAAGGSSSTGGAKENYLEQLYLLRAFGTRKDGDGTVLVPSQDIAQADRNLLGAILENKGYCNSKDEIERDLLTLFRWHNGLARNSWAPVCSKILDGDSDIHAEWLVPNWILARREHVMYSKAGVGKTMLSIQLARAITGDPTMNSFLDSGPISGYERWGRNRVLFIGTDMYDSAEEMTNTYIASLGLAHSEFLKYVDWWFEDSEAGTPGWTLSLRHLIQLYQHLKEQRSSGRPVSAVIIDSMKAVCPDHLLVGHQAFKDYLRLVYDICSRFGAALIWIHHSGKDGGAQGIQRITEGAAGVFRMERDKETQQVVMEIEKLRGGGRTRKLFINPFAHGEPAVLMNPNAAADEESLGPVISRSQTRHELILTLLQEHFDAHRSANPTTLGSTISLLYKGMGRAELEEATGSSKRELLNDLQQLSNQGLIEAKGHAKSKTYRLRLDDLGDPQNGFDAFTALS